MKKLKSLFIVTFLLSVCALCFAACRTTKPPPTLPQIGAPTNLRREENFLVWNAVDGATSYVVSVEGAEHESSETRFDLATITDPADYLIRVKARGDGFADSDWVTRNYRYEVGTFTYRMIDDGSAYEVSGALTLKDGAAKIPSKYKNLPVVAIGEKAFFNKRELTSVELPDSVTVIKDGAFQACTALKSVNLPKNLTELGESAFYSTALTSVTIPDKITALPKSVFGSCQSLESVVFPEGLTNIGQLAFTNCKNLKTAVLPEGLQSVGERAFLSCANYEPNLPAGIREIVGMAFSGTAIKTFTLPHNITIVPYFTNCIQLTEIILHEGVTEIRSFRNTAIKSIDIPDGVTEIPKSAFADCASLREVRLPQNLKIINDGAFMNCTALEAIAFPETLTSFSYNEPVPFGMKSTEKGAFKGCTKLKKFNIVDTVNYVGRETFSDTAWFNAQPNGAVYYGRVFYKYKGIAPENTELTIREGTIAVAPEACCERNSIGATIKNNITKVNFPESLTIIYDHAFSSCRLTELILSHNVTTIGIRTFGNVYGKIVLSPKLQTIGDGALDVTKEFQEASGEIFIPKSVIYLGARNFSNVNYLNRLVFEDPTGWYWDCNAYTDYYTLNHELEFLHSYNGTPIAVPKDVVADSIMATKLFCRIPSASGGPDHYPMLKKQ